MELARIDIDPEADREAWLADRAKRITATDAAAILGLSPYASPLDVYLAKLGLDVAKPQTAAMRIGLLMEPVALRLYTDATGREIVDTQVYAHHSARDWQAATFDAIDSAGEIVEVKTVGLRSPVIQEIGEPGTEELPLAWLAQIYHQLEVSQASACQVAVLMGTDFQLFRVERNAASQEAVTSSEVAFWDRHVQKRKPPKAEKASDADALAKLFPDREGGAIWTDDATLGAVREYVGLGEKEHEIKVRRGLLKASLLEALGSLASATTSDGHVVTAKTISRNGYEVKPTSYLDFRVKAPKFGKST